MSELIYLRYLAFRKMISCWLFIIPPCVLILSLLLHNVIDARPGLKPLGYDTTPHE